MRLSILVPIYNEVENIPLLCPALLEVLNRSPHEFEIILVNDGSTDGSSEALDVAAASDSRVRVIHLRRNFGQTAALMAAIDHATGDVLIPMDGDLQNDPEDIPRLLAKLDEGYDVVSGWRKNRKDKAVTRRLPSIVANWLISKLSGVALHDYGCTLKAYRRSILENVRLYGEMHRFVPIYAAWEGAEIAELEVNHHPRRLGVSKYGLGRVTKVMLDLVLIRFMHTAFDRPMHFFGKIGLASIGLAGLTGLWAVWLKMLHQVSFISTPLPMFTMFLMLSGILFVLLGLMAELQMRVYYESQSKRHYSVKKMSNVALEHSEIVRVN
ncbi:MAG: glycosyltransferase family 2 protein [Sulfuritalea sp.]|nr:glycosyltransferase family 2 protein [Sulfuritalea sp.]